MDTQIMHKIEDNLWNVLGDYAKGFKSPAEVETVKHALSGIFKIKCLEEMEDYQSSHDYGGRSYDRYYNDDMSYRRSRDNRDNDGRYSRDMYSRDGGGMMMRERLEQLRNEAKDEHQRRIIDDMLNRL
jgi:hypothetical protein